MTPTKEGRSTFSPKFIGLGSLWKSSCSFWPSKLARTKPCAQKDKRARRRQVVVVQLVQQGVTARKALANLKPQDNDDLAVRGEGGRREGKRKERAFFFFLFSFDDFMTRQQGMRY